MIQTWDTFWVRNVNLYYGEKVAGKVVKLENKDEMPYLTYQHANIKMHEFISVFTDQDSYKKSFVCEKDLDWFNFDVSASYQLILFYKDFFFYQFLLDTLNKLSVLVIQVFFLLSNKVLGKNYQNKLQLIRNHKTLFHVSYKKIIDLLRLLPY